MKSIANDVESSENVKELFDLVKEAVRLSINESRTGIDLGLIDLGNSTNQLVSAFYHTGSNIIVMNKTPLKRIAQTNPYLMKPYVFVVLLHEYLHSLGYLDESTTRKMTEKITKNIFNGSVATEMAHDLRKFFPFLLYPGGHPAMDNMEVLEMDDVDYIG